MNASNNTLPDCELVPRIEHAGPLLIAGLREPLDAQAAEKIPQLWQRLTSCRNEIPQQTGNADYGVCIHLQGHEYYYMAGCAVWDFTGLPDTFSPFIIPSQTYAVFAHAGPVTRIRATIDMAFDHWLPASGYQQATAADNALHFFERYGDAFDPYTGEGDIEIWLPIARRQPRA